MFGYAHDCQMWRHRSAARPRSNALRAQTTRDDDIFDISPRARDAAKSYLSPRAPNMFGYAHDWHVWRRRSVARLRNSALQVQTTRDDDIFDIFSAPARRREELPSSACSKYVRLRT